MTDPTDVAEPTIYDLVRAVRSHPDARAVVVFTAGDCEDPEGEVDWSSVEDRMTERGWESIDYYLPDRDEDE